MLLLNSLFPIQMSVKTYKISIKLTQIIFRRGNNDLSSPKQLRAWIGRVAGLDECSWEQNIIFIKFRKLITANDWQINRRNFWNWFFHDRPWSRRAKTSQFLSGVTVYESKDQLVSQLFQSFANRFANTRTRDCIGIISTGSAENIEIDKLLIKPSWYLRPIMR